MGGKDEASSMVKPSIESTKDSVSEATISQLLSHFKSAELLTQSTQHDSTGTGSDKQCAYRQVLSSMKHLHLKKPVNVRRRQKCGKVKHLSVNKLNLSVAAVNIWKPVVWPAKLNGLTKKTESSVLHPSRLQLGSKEKGSLGASVFKTSIRSTSFEEKARIKASIARQNLPVFDFDRLSDTNIQCFSCLKEAKSDDKNSSLEIGNPADGDFSSLTSSSSKSFKRHSSSSVPPAKHAKRAGESRDSTGSNLVTFSRYRHRLRPSDDRCSPSGHSCSSEGNNRESSQSHLTSSRLHTRQIPSSLSSPSLSASLPVQPAVGASGVSVQRTCSQELRAEEANVNELASYFEDFLHIPRKMSTMAEMMYA